MNDTEYILWKFNEQAVTRETLRLLGGELTALRAENARLQAELAAAQQQLEFDRTTCHNFIKALDVALDGRFWLTEGRGSYSWDDDRYREEFHDAAKTLMAVIEPMRKMAQNLSSRLPTTEAIMKARVDLEARAEAAEKELVARRIENDGQRIINGQLADQLTAAITRLCELSQILNPHEAYDATKIAGWARDTVEQAGEADAALAHAAELREILMAGKADRWAATTGNSEAGQFQPTEWVRRAEDAIEAVEAANAPPNP